MSQARHFKKGLKSFGNAIGAGLEALAEAQREADRRTAEAAEIEKQERSAVEDQIEHYEDVTGQKFVLRSSAEERAIIGSNLPWDPDNKGHLMNCGLNCNITHCLTCGKHNYGFVYCSDHR